MRMSYCEAFWGRTPYGTVFEHLNQKEHSDIQKAGNAPKLLLS